MNHYSTSSRRSFFKFLLSLIIALFFPKEAFPKKEQKIVVTLVPQENPSDPPYRAEGATIEEAMANLQKEIEYCTFPFDEYFQEVFAEATEALKKDPTDYRHWDMSAPEEAFIINVTYA